MTVMSNTISVIILLFVGFLFYLATVMDNHERKQHKVDKPKDS
jgi:hypothetical protein